MPFFFKSITGKDIQIRGVSFNCRESPKGIYLVINDSNGGKVEYWELVEQQTIVHSLFSTSASTSKFLNWQCLIAFNHSDPLTSLCPSRNVWITGHDSIVQTQHHLVVATADGLICLQQESLKIVYPYNFRFLHLLYSHSF